MNDDELVRRLRDALDEVHATPAESLPERSIGALHVTRRPRRALLLTAAAAVVLLVAGAAWLGSGHRTHTTAPADSAGVATDPTSDVSDPTGKPTSTPTSAPVTTTPPAAARYEGTVATIIDSGNGPMLAWSLASSLPPQGGDLPLAGFDWGMVDGERTVGGTTWTEGTAYRVVGTWDGTTFTLTHPPTPVTPPTALGDLSHVSVTPNCPESQFDALSSEVVANFTQLHLTSAFPDTWDGRCRLYVTVAVETTASDALAVQHQLDVYVDAALRPADDPSTVAHLVAPEVGVDVSGFYGFHPAKLLNIVALPADRTLRTGSDIPAYTRDLAISDALARLQPGDEVQWVWADRRVQRLRVVEVVPYEAAFPNSTVLFVEIHPSLGPPLHVMLELQA